MTPASSGTRDLSGKKRKKKRREVTLLLGNTALKKREAVEGEVQSLPGWGFHEFEDPLQDYRGAMG